MCDVNIKALIKARGLALIEEIKVVCMVVFCKEMDDVFNEKVVEVNKREKVVVNVKLEFICV